MAAISDPLAIKFVNEQIRPICEQIRALKVLMNSTQTNWQAGLNAVFATGADTVNDGRTAEGVSRLTANDVTQVMSALTSLIAAVNDQIIAKPCVRALTAG